jgi:hypothetical protein
MANFSLPYPSGTFRSFSYSPDNDLLNLVLLKTSLTSFSPGYTSYEISDQIQLFPNPAKNLERAFSGSAIQGDAL